MRKPFNVLHADGVFTHFLISYMFVIVQGIVCIAPCIEIAFQLDMLKYCSKWLLDLSACVPDAASVVQDYPGHAH